MRHSYYDYCVVGAGPSGLTVAYQLVRAGRRVLVVERDDRVGGLAKSHNYGGHVFDTGPKRFHTDDPIVTDFIAHIMREGLATIGRSTKVHFLGKYFDWPLRTPDMIKLPLGTAVRCLVDLIRERRIIDQDSFHEFIQFKYGETLYATFFAPYTEKFLRWNPEDIHRDWASTGINRTVIDKRIKANTLFDIFRAVLLPEKIDTEFLYPSHGGFGGFYERLFALCQQAETFDVVLGDRILKLEDQGGRFGAMTSAGHSVSFGELIWSGNLNDLSALLGGPEERKVAYLNTIFYNVICREAGVRANRAQWIYVSRGDSLISRITCMKEFSPYTCPDGYYNLICELTDSQRKPSYFLRPEAFTQSVVDELVQMSFLKGPQWVEDVRLNPVVDTYPIYHRQYLKDFGAVARGVKKFSRRVHLLGRSGAFWYNNSDHSIRFAIEMADRLLGHRETEFDYRGYFGGPPGRAAHPKGK